MKVRRALALFLFAAGCFGLGLAAARWAGWQAAPVSPQAPALPVDGPVATGAEPRIYIDAGAVVLYSGSLTIHPPPPPRVPAE